MALLANSGSVSDSKSSAGVWHVQVAELIRWLTAANPNERPSAREVLRSELLPPTVGDEQLTDLLRSLPDKCVTPPLTAQTPSECSVCASKPTHW